MTREEKLWTMRMQDLKAVADKLGIKINTKAAKSLAIEKILAAEEMNKQDDKETAKQEKVAEKTLKDQYTKKKEIVPEKIKTKNEFLNAVGDILDGKATVASAPKLVPMPGTEDPAVPVKPVETPENPKVNKTTKKPKKANLKLSELTYKGETKSIRTWAEELNMPRATLYDRVNRNGWPVDLAIETPLGRRRPKKAFEGK